MSKNFPKKYFKNSKGISKSKLPKKLPNKFLSNFKEIYRINTQRNCQKYPKEMFQKNSKEITAGINKDIPERIRKSKHIEKIAVYLLQLLQKISNKLGRFFFKKFMKKISMNLPKIILNRIAKGIKKIIRRNF